MLQGVYKKYKWKHLCSNMQVRMNYGNSITKKTGAINLSRCFLYQQHHHSICHLSDRNATMELVLPQMFVNVKVALEGETALNVRIAYLNLMVFLFVLIFSFSIFIWHSELYCLCGEILCRLLDGD